MKLLISNPCWDGQIARYVRVMNVLMLAFRIKIILTLCCPSLNPQVGSVHLWVSIYTPVRAIFWGVVAVFHVIATRTISCVVGTVILPVCDIRRQETESHHTRLKLGSRSGVYFFTERRFGCDIMQRPTNRL